MGGTLCDAGLEGGSRVRRPRPQNKAIKDPRQKGEKALTSRETIRGDLIIRWDSLSLHCAAAKGASNNIIFPLRDRARDLALILKPPKSLSVQLLRLMPLLFSLPQRFRPLYTVRSRSRSSAIVSRPGLSLSLSFGGYGLAVCRWRRSRRVGPIHFFSPFSF